MLPVGGLVSSDIVSVVASADTTDFIEENMALVISLAEDADGRIKAVEEIAAEVSAEVEEKITGKILA